MNASAGSAYCGRFAPSPTGRLHLGSLFAAAGSFLEARASGGTWLVRMEDLDAPRVVPGAADDILRTLELLGLEWDGPVLYQSRRTEAYEVALAQLESQQQIFRCSCSRRELAAAAPAAGAVQDEDLFYPGTCRAGVRHPNRPPAWRFRVADQEVDFIDRLQGPCRQNVGRSIGDFVIRRRDGLFAYQLAVVVDDAAQGVTDVVRGCDLLSSTSRQILLQRALGLPQPGYAHLPLLLEADGQKASKSRRSLPVEAEGTALLIHRVLVLLGQSPPADLASATPRDLWRWAIAHWKPDALLARTHIPLDSN